jgi:16S rRNA (uracil1498-N3)-methyltransferase
VSTGAVPPSAFAASAGAAAHVFADSLDDTVFVTGEDGHHLQRVRRLRSGERVTVADGNGSWRAYVVSRLAQGALSLAADGEVHGEPVLQPALAVAFALSKGPKPETVVSGLTELGVDLILPFRSARSVVRWEGDRVPTATARLRRVAREAAMQCRRARLPEIAEPVDVLTLALHPGVVLGDPAGLPVAEIAPPREGEWLAVVGPEGGLDTAEREQLTGGEGATTVAVGPHVLRTETAAVALAAALATRRRAA